MNRDKLVRPFLFPRNPGFLLKHHYLAKMKSIVLNAAGDNIIVRTVTANWLKQQRFVEIPLRPLLPRNVQTLVALSHRSYHK